MLEISQRLIFGKGDILLQDLQGKVIRTYSKRHFLKGSRHQVTNSLLGEISGNLLIEINVPIEVEVTFVAQINANVTGATAHASAPGAEAYANEVGAKAHANVDGAKAYATTRGAEAHANARYATAIATKAGAKAYANVKDAIADVGAPEDLATPLS